ncbi:SdrD B-like domain-containing protein [Rhodobacter sp. CZR27]|uniref:SdrD B-like domain-containing protein n=1 Tax=Rhodobacter sp. CZR27 TaxID=2033869 RepID=UPI000BBF0875|nr:SdrD B-like domain-containing protein [Rhodobacter sp. CZR27]
MTFLYNLNNFEFTAFSAGQLLSQGTMGASVSVGDSFTMPAAADTALKVADDDRFLSGDSCRDNNADDGCGQQASIVTDGTAAGNGGQVYAESYFWVQDQCGKKYMLVEIEQEGSAGTYYTFNSSCGLPAAGAKLTVVSQCNVTSNWIDYCNLGAGSLEKLGTVSGSVFGDTNCDGINGTLGTIPGCDYLIEAEAMCKTSSLVTICDSGASGGKFVRLACPGGKGELTTSFNGKSGTYDLTLRLQDENDGQSTIRLVIDGREVEAIRLSRDSDGGGSDCGPFSTYVIRDVQIDCGDQIRLAVAGSCSEYVRIDSLRLEGHDTTVRTPEPPRAGVTVKLVDLSGRVVATTTTDANGAYSFENVRAGQYKVVGVAPDGTEFTLRDAGTDDSLDSDVDAGGASDVLTVRGGETVDVDLGLCTFRPASISGRYFVDTDNSGTDQAEPGVGGVTVQLMGADGRVVATTTTAADGSYSFGGLKAGDYTVAFGDDPAGRVFVGRDVGGDDTVDSDVNPATGRTDRITLGRGEAKTDVDAGVRDPRTASIGDTVFLDADGDGVQDATEAGADGVEVTLLNGKGAVVASTTTANGGQYSFTGLAAGSYSVVFGTLAGHAFTTRGAEAADAVNGDSDANLLGLTDTFVLSIGEVETDIDAGLVRLNTAPVALNDTGRGCANETITLDVLANDSDDDGDTLVIATVDGHTIREGETIATARGTLVTLSDGKLSFDGTAAHADLNVGERGYETVRYTVSDGRGGTAAAEVELSFCGVADTLEELCESLPDRVEYQLVSGYQNGTSDAYSMRIAGTGDARFDGQVITTAYCASAYELASMGTSFSNAPVFTGNLYCATDAAAVARVLAGQTGSNGLAAAENIDLITWLLNQDFTGTRFNDAEVQAAIWNLTDGLNSIGSNFGQLADVHELVDLAIRNGEGFVPGTDDVVALVVDPDPVTADNAQPFILGVSFGALDCLC